MVLVSSSFPCFADSEDFAEAVTAHVRKIEKELGCRIGLSYHDASLPLTIEYRANEYFHAASTIRYR
jgi:hypothetical protein